MYHYDKNQQKTSRLIDILMRTLQEKYPIGLTVLKIFSTLCDKQAQLRVRPSNQEIIFTEALICQVGLASVSKTLESGSNTEFCTEKSTVNKMFCLQYLYVVEYQCN